MREKKKSLKLKKFKVANLHLAVRVKGGNSNPCHATSPGHEPLPTATACSDDCCSKDISTCSVGNYLSDENDGCGTRSKEDC